MKKFLLLSFILFAGLTSFAQNYILQGVTGVTGPTGTSASVIYQDGSGNIGIGNTGPTGSLDVTATSFSAATVIAADYIQGVAYPNYFQASRTPTSPGFPSGIIYGTPVIDFQINATGQVGIGTTANSFAGGVTSEDLLIQDHGYNPCGDVGNIAFMLLDDGGNPLIGIGNTGTSTASSGGLYILSNSTATCPSMSSANLALAVIDPSGTLNGFTLSATGNGLVGVGINPSIGQVAQLDVMQNNSAAVDYLFHVGNTSVANPTLFSIANNGFVNIGQLNPPAGLLEISDVNGAGADGTPLLLIDNGSPISPYFMVRGSSSGVNVGIGVDPIANSDYPSTLAIKGVGGTTLDLYGSGNIFTGVAQMRFMNPADGTIRHLITDNGHLLIYPGFSEGVSNIVEIEGNEQVDLNEHIEGNAQVDGNEGVDNGINLNQPNPGSGTWYNQLNFMDGSGNIKQTMCNSGDDLILSLNPFGNGSGNVKVAGTVVIGNVTTPCTTGSCYQLYVQQGILAERFKCAAASDATNWSDYVFNKSYKLMSVEDLEKFVKKNKHLPDIPTAADVKSDGIDLADMDAKLLAKIEELSLYIIEQQKQINELKKKVK